VIPALTCGVMASMMILAWMWSSDPAPVGSVDIGGGVRLPTYVSGHLSHSWWAMVVLILTAVALYLAYLFSYLYLWTVFPQMWPGSAGRHMPAAGAPLASGILLGLGTAAILAASRILARRSSPGIPFILLIVFAGASVSASLGLDVRAHWVAGLRPDTNSYGAMVYLGAILQLELVLPLLIMAGFVLARLGAGRLDRARRVTFDNLALLSHYTVGQGLLGLILVHGFPRLVG
jgi:cytochrome c oxidase subunit I+III